MSLNGLKHVVTIMMIVCFSWGCGSPVTPSLLPDYDEKGIRLIALMPIQNKTQDPLAAQVLREVLAEELYFKGYPRIPIRLVDDKLREIYRGRIEFEDKIIPPQAVGESLGVDAVMYCTLEEWKTSYVMIYAPTTVAASFVLWSTKTGEMIWNTSHRVVKRDYDLSGKGLEMKSRQSCETAAQEVVEKAMVTLPDGPEYPGRPPKKENSFFGLW
ncbi:MAG TPA: hypothetical protein ENO00_15280 [Deltaproteobacteria bacterium]|nr:hypothetical protein [Deltaproteobacteria bacterium]